MIFSEREGGAAEVRAAYQTEEQLNEAKDAGIDYHEFGVVSIFFEISEEDNPAFDAIFSIYDKIKYPLATGEGDDCVQQSFMLEEDMDLEDLIPLDADLEENGFFSYEGSLTTPPCTTNGM